MDQFGPALESRRMPRRMPWWTSPAGINFGFLLPVLLLIAYAGSTSYAGLTIRGIRFLTADYILLGCGILVVIGLSGWIGSHVSLGSGAGRRLGDADDDRAGNRAAAVIGCITLFAYVYWFKDFLLNPLLLLNTFLGKYRPDRTNIQLTTGLTSLANMGPAFFSIYAHKVIATRTKLPRLLHVLCFALVAFTLFRVYAWSERLAMIEAVIPFGLVLSGSWAATKGRISGMLLRLGPFFAVPLLIMYFAVFEYVRSWQSDTYNKHLGFWEFAIGRLASYYYTSLNNGAGMLVTGRWPTYTFENVLGWLHKAPIFGPMFSQAVDLQPMQLTEFLTKFGDVEFNNPSGIYAVIYDLGFPWGTIYFCVVGLVGGMIYRAYRSGTLAGVMLYPVFFISFLEVFRFPYLGTSRAFTWVLGIGVALIMSLRTPQSEHVRVARNGRHTLPTA